MAAEGRSVLRAHSQTCRCVTAKGQSWKQEQKGRGRFGALFVLQQELTAGFWGHGSSGAPWAFWGEGWCPNQGAHTKEGNKIYVIISSFIARRPIRATVLIGQCLADLLNVLAVPADEFSWAMLVCLCSWSTSGMCLLKRYHLLCIISKKEKVIKHMKSFHWQRSWCAEMWWFYKAQPVLGDLLLSSV